MNRSQQSPWGHFRNWLKSQGIFRSVQREQSTIGLLTKAEGIPERVLISELLTIEVLSLDVLLALFSSGVDCAYLLRQEILQMIRKC